MSLCVAEECGVTIEPLVENGYNGVDQGRTRQYGSSYGRDATHVSAGVRRDVHRHHRGVVTGGEEANPGRPIRTGSIEHITQSGVGLSVTRVQDTPSIYQDIDSETISKRKTDRWGGRNAVNSKGA